MANLTHREIELLAQSWVCLCAGEARVVRVYSDGERHHVEFVGCETQRLPKRELDVLLPLLLGKAQKVVAAEALRSGSSITGIAMSALRRLGIDCRPNNVPMIAVMMARASVSVFRRRSERDTIARGLSQGTFLFSVERPDIWLGHSLTPTEQKVVRLRIDGNSHDQVAEECGVSRRTVANQVASAYRKLGVSARVELLNRILDATQPATPVPTTMAPAGALAELSAQDCRDRRERGMVTAGTVKDARVPHGSACSEGLEDRRRLVGASA